MRSFMNVPQIYKVKRKLISRYNHALFFGINRGSPGIPRGPMFKFIRNHLFKPKEERPVFTAAAAPERLLYVIGDVHGRDDLLWPLLDKIERDAAKTPHDLVMVGDYVDRGEASATVIRRLQTLSKAPHIKCLMGNHERMLLDFIDDPVKNGRRWIRNGGLQTLASFGVGGFTETAGHDVMIRGRDAFLDALGLLEPWLRTLALSFQSGNVAVVHAGADPRLPILDQPAKNLIWGHPNFSQLPRSDGIWVVHGHTIVDAACTETGRISIDTGAYATGRLSAAAISANCVRFL